MPRGGQSNRITRRKSAASIHSQRHIDPETSRQQAYAAATYAFARAQERSGDMGPGSAVAAANTANPREENIRPRTDNGTRGGVLKHKQSVRFAGPLAAPRPALGTRTIQQNSVQKKLSTGSPRPQESTGDAPVHSAYRPQSRSSSLKASFRQVGPESYATALAAYDEYYTREDDVVTTPSSYRKIRRSKSMLHPATAQGPLFSNGTPESSIVGQRNYGLFRSKSNIALRAPKSMGFLQGGRSRSARNPEYDVAVQVARDKFLHQVEQQRLREQPSFLFRSSKARRREEKSLRRSFRANSSTNSYGMPIASENQNYHRSWDDTLKNRARQASKSFKNKLKGLFRRSNGDGSGAIPDKEVQAQKSHITDYEIQIGPPMALSSAYEESPPGRATLSSVSTQQPSLRMVPSSHRLRSIAGSMQSLTSEASSKSRVMSWTNTDTTANSRYAAAERERERLSVINENGTHKASSSFNRPPLKNQYSAYPDFNPPGSTRGHPPPFVGQVDSARVYSALMRRLDENSPEAKLTKQKENSRTCRSPKRDVPGSGSVDSRQSSQGYKSTIIRVNNSSENLSTSTDRFQNMNQSNDVFYTARSYNDSGSVGHKRGHSNSSASTVITRKSNYRAYPPPIMGGLPTKISPQEAMATVELQGTVSRGPRETRSTFFGRTELTNIGGTPSPYRRAMAEADLNSTMTKMGMSSANSSPLLPDSLRRAKSALSLADSETDKREAGGIDSAYTESIYSRTTSGRTPPDMTESPRANEDSTPRKLGSAVLVERTTYCPSAPLHRVNASTGSTDWKAWMSAQVSKLERAKENVDAATSAVHLVPHVVPTMPKIFGAHIRETAQISGDDTAFSVPKATTITNQPLEVLQEDANVSPKPILKSKLSSSSQLAPNVTPTPSQRVMHSSLRQVPSRCSMKGVSTVLKERVVSNSAANVMGTSTGNSPYSQRESANTRQKMQRKQSSATLRCVQTQTPIKLVKKIGRRASNDNAQLRSPEAEFVQVVAEKKFASVGGRVAEMENWTPAKADGLGGAEGVMVGGRSLGLNGQVMGSRRMVDLFLSSRRKRVAGSEDSNVFL
ncbi:hypothetical protein VC83_07091 [Pseudogymnoascus destructans]|uniref:Uncharacterized protein n=2 Tax=Pseudogymnoascus destructans TaxID=655981 RepID=L8FYB4_PSED2|nr:uncharacterized protein VC83_07091 [Pseudogymnoascus destructans]ELR04666.1 hypothetical protein GMDG_01525 [Pseudogymnoascus destructans 20631-21]OAF56896.1 hypothetical protein VC83_07091 [Pseudogymnoascus destructans]